MLARAKLSLSLLRTFMQLLLSCMLPLFIADQAHNVLRAGGVEVAVNIRIGKASVGQHSSARSTFCATAHLADQACHVLRADGIEVAANMRILTVSAGQHSRACCARHHVATSTYVLAPSSLSPPKG